VVKVEEDPILAYHSSWLPKEEALQLAASKLEEMGRWEVFSIHLWAIS
jgi:hypothetical protein